MKCQSCGKKDANIKYYENINGMKQTLYFCEECAKKLGFSDLSSLFSPIFTTLPEFNLLEKKKCDLCGYTLDSYLNTGLLGCEACYKAFEDSIDELLYKINGKNRHIKLKEFENVENNYKETNIEKLKKKLEKLIEEEKYEEAAIIRDEIKKIKSNSEG